MTDTQARVRAAAAPLRWLAAASVAAAAAGATSVLALRTRATMPGDGAAGDMLAWVVVAVAGAIAVLCAYLTAIWLLAAVASLRGDAGRSALALLRLVAPSLARRVAAGTAAAGAVATLVVLPAQAAVIHGDGPGPEPSPSASSSSAALSGTVSFSAPDPVLPAMSAASGTKAPVLAPAEPNDTGSDDAGSELPSLGWGDGAQDSAGSQHETGEQGTTGSPVRAAPPEKRAERPQFRAAHEIVVADGDCLWSIAEEELGGDPSPAQIDAAWRTIYAANRDRIGSDPDLILTGQHLVVPDSTSLTEAQEKP